MPGPERQPNALPPQLAEFLKDRFYACVTQATDQGTVFVIKTPNQEIRSLRGRVPISIRHQLYAHPAAPVIRILLMIYDEPQDPLALETFINVEDSQQRADYAALTAQPDLHLLFYDKSLRHRLSKTVTNAAREDITEILVQADALLATIPRGRFDFDRAKEVIMRNTSLSF